MFFLENDHYSKTCNCEKTTNKKDHKYERDIKIRYVTYFTQIYFCFYVIFFTTSAIILKAH